MKLNAMHYALPQRRLRLVILGIRMVMEHFGLELDVAECNAVLAKAQRSLSSMKRQPPSHLDIMLKGTDTHVKNHLQKFKIEPQDWCAKAAQSGWPELHMDTMQKHGMRWGDVQPDQETKDSPWYQHLPAREKECACFARAMQGENAVADISKSITHMAYGFTEESNKQKLMLPTIMPGAKIWVQPRHRLLLGRELLMCQGYPVSALPPSRKDGDHEELMCDLAGNAFPGTMIMAATVALLAHVPWEKAKKKASSTCATCAPTPPPRINAALSLARRVMRAPSMD